MKQTFEPLDFLHSQQNHTTGPIAQSDMKSGHTFLLMSEPSLDSTCARLTGQHTHTAVACTCLGLAYILQVLQSKERI